MELKTKLNGNNYFLGHFVLWFLPGRPTSALLTFWAAGFFGVGLAFSTVGSLVVSLPLPIRCP